MKIAFFTDTYKPQVNGVVTSIEAFSHELRRQGHEVHIFAPTGSGKYVHKMPSFSFRPYPGYRIGVPLSEEILLRFRNFSFDVIHVHTPISLGAVGVGIAKRLKIGVAGTFHTILPEYTHYFGKLMGLKGVRKIAKKGAWRYCSWFYNRFDAVIAPSEHTLRVLRRHNVKRPLFVVPTGIDTRGIRASRTGRKQTILHVGRVTKEKNIETIADALEKLPEGVTLRLASEGPHLERIRKYVNEKNLRKRVVFLGYLSENELDREYRRAGVFVMASKTETQALVLLEASLRGLPVIALEAPVTADFVRDNKAGIVSGKKELPENIMKVLGNRSSGMSDEKIRKIREKYDISRCTQELLSVYEKAILRHQNTT